MRHPLLRIRRGHAPNCSSGSSVVGVALISATIAGALINLWADRFTEWIDDDENDDNKNDAPPPRLRAEHFGAILAWAGVQLYLSPAWAAKAAQAGAMTVGATTPTPLPGALQAPTEVHLSLTRRCPVRCEGCYLDAGPDAEHSDLDEMENTLRQLAEMGVFEVAFGGGEALLRPGLLQLAVTARSLGITPNLTTSGFGITDAIAEQLAAVMGQVNVSIDGLGATYTAARGWDGADRGLRAVRRLKNAGARVGINTVLSRPLLEDPGALDALADAIAEAGAVEWQWLRFKPVGRAQNRAVWSRLAPDTAQLQTLWPKALALEARTGLVLRFDCAMTPFLADAGVPVSQMTQLGVVGCTGAESLWARTAAGGWAPCSFVPGETRSGSLSSRWREDESLQAWRDRACAPPEPCARCEHQEICRGGCRAVSAALLGDAMAPDPQCPKVQAWKTASP